MKEMTIKFETNTILVTKSFYEKAKEYGSYEYQKLREVQNELKYMSVEVRQVKLSTKRKNPNKGLTIAYMRKFIKTLDSSNLENFDSMVADAKEVSHNGSEKYHYVKKWFVENYPDHKSLIVDTLAQKTSRPKVELQNIIASRKTA